MTMNDDEARALGARIIVAGLRFRPEPGADLVHHEWLNKNAGLAGVYRCPVTGMLWRVDHGCWWPDSRDPATLGTWLATVRERHGTDAYAAPVRMLGHADAIVLSGPRKGRRVGPDGWAVYGLGLDVLPVGANEAEALVAALEAGAR